MTRPAWIIVNILTFGIPLMVVSSKARKTANNINKELLINTKINFDINDLITCFGGKQNIVNCCSTISSVTITLVKMLNFTKEAFKQFKIKGLIKSNNKITLLFGDNSPTIARLINEIIKQQ